ncbi:carbon monoxide dehydrogenase [Lysinibacillus capsici]|uniref:carbon monoxide dehydrogenase n=1 Tax=Lysinibacillus capsici TaxID=2115968 RepID=UPI002E21A445|nr:carbon monoxide dehydrogenase [Lysinibacillus capsici]
MLKKITFSLCIFLINQTIEHASAHPLPPTFEEKFDEAGYQSVEAAVKEFEQHYSKVKLPTVLPPFSITHKFGRFYKDPLYGMNDSLNILYVHNEMKQHIFNIDIRPIQPKVSFSGKAYTLQDGRQGIYFEHLLFNFFVFEERNLQYLLGIYKDSTNQETPNLFVQIANSIKSNEVATFIYFPSSIQ